MGEEKQTDQWLDCPNCEDNQGFTIEAYPSRYFAGDEYIQQQCEWCYETPNSKFNLEQIKARVRGDHLK